MRIGFSLGSLLSVNEILDCARVLNNYNPDSIWVPETWGMDCSPMLASISQIATRPKIGSSIINIYSRTPALIAMSAATLDLLSNGRFMLGLGTSSEAIVEEWHGLEFEEPLQRMSEYVEVIKKALSGKKIIHDGKFFHLRNFALLIKPVRASVPIYIAAINQKMVELAWSVGDGVIFYLRPIDEMQNTITRMTEKKRIDVACQLITCVSDDLDEALARAKKTISFYVSVGKIYREFLAKNGFSKETEEIFDEYKKSGLGRTHNFVPDSMVESLALCGTPGEIPKKLRRFTAAGIDLPIIQFNPIGDVAKSFKTLLASLEGEM
ncbi:MAG TPA: LLM class flavin-dependent oxidoreductase [Candidatus Nitrosotalea sp.]|nr:LLM class flavin-dependent oxidoreductase [Candidatus Nitrosotalea sp.]